MAMRAKRVAGSEEHLSEADILEITQGRIDVCLIGTSPLLFNAMSAKAMRELLMPRGRLTAAARQTTQKHEPHQEYRDSIHRLMHVDGPTRIACPPTWIKRAISSAALDIPGATRTQISRLVWVPEGLIPVYGAPMLHMGIVRMMDMARTPDVRSRAILPEWALACSIYFVQPNLTAKVVTKLLAAAGVLGGLGDMRQGKGAGSMGQFRIVSPDDPDYVRICRTGGRVIQDSALAHPQPYDAEAEELLAWFTDERARRGREREIAQELAESEETEESGNGRSVRGKAGNTGNRGRKSGNGNAGARAAGRA